MTIETQTKITVDMLTENSVSILKQEMAEIEGRQTQIGDNFRCAYVNSESGRKQVQDELDAPYVSAIFAVWGETPTVEE